MVLIKHLFNFFKEALTQRIDLFAALTGKLLQQLLSAVLSSLSRSLNPEHHQLIPAPT